MFNNFGFLPADPHSAYSGAGFGSPGAFFAQLDPGANVFETPGGSIDMAASVIGAEAMPAEASMAPPGTVPIALDVGGSGVVQDVQGGGGEEGTIAAFLPPGAERYFDQGQSFLAQRAVLGVPNWIWLAAAAGALLLRGR